MNYDPDAELEKGRPRSPQRLENPVDLTRLIKDGNATVDFVHDPYRQQDDFDVDDSEEVFREKIYNHVNLEVLDGGDEDEDSDLSPFEKIKKKMKNVTDDGKVMKKITKEGTGEICPPNAHVKIHYQGYVEHKEVPFDVSYLRSKEPESYKLGEGGLVTGLELGIQTMRAGENATFLVHYDYAFKKFGCGQRIPKEATVMFEVVLVSFSANDENLTDDKVEDATFETTAKKAEAHVKKGSERFSQDRDVDLAIKHYKKARSLILDFGLKEDQDGTLARLLERVYQNLAICYNRKRDYKETIRMAKDAMILIKPLAEKNFKLKFAWGKALCGIDDYVGALEKFREVKMMQPDNQETNRELKVLEDKWKKYRDSSKATAKSFFKFDTNDKPDEKDPEVPASFIDDITNQLKEMKLNENMRFCNLNPGLTGKERKVVKDIAAKLGLHYGEHNASGQEMIVIRK